MPHLAIQTLLAYKQADQIEAAAKCFQRMLDFEEAPGIFPYRWFYDHLDVRHASPFPWPGLRKLLWPDPHEVLPPGVGAALLSAYPQIAAEALQATNAELDLAAQEPATGHRIPPEPAPPRARPAGGLPGTGRRAAGQGMGLSAHKP